MKDPKFEASKEVARWIMFFVISAIISFVITATLQQINAVPESLTIKVWVFSYVIPVREALTFVLTMVGRFADKWRFEETKSNITYVGDKPKGVLPF